MGVGSYGRGGGLALLWSDAICVKVQSYDKMHIDVMVVDTLSGGSYGGSLVSMVKRCGNFGIIDS